MWQSKETAPSIIEALYPGPRNRHVQEAALWACLEGQTAKAPSAWRSPRLGVGQSRSGRGLSLRIEAKRKDSPATLSWRHIFSRGLSRKMLPLAGEFRPLRRSTRRCPPWTRTGLMSGDRKATRYRASGFGHGFTSWQEAVCELFVNLCVIVHENGKNTPLPAGRVKGVVSHELSEVARRPGPPPGSPG